MMSNHSCCHCGRHTQQLIRLRDRSYIEPKCLNQLQLLVSDPSVDEEIQQIYQVILQQVVRCSKCTTIIDGLNRKNNGDDKNPICDQCAPKKHHVESNHQCFACEKKLSGMQLLGAASLGGMLMCAECYSQQESSFKVKEGKKEKKEVEEKPEKEQTGLEALFSSDAKPDAKSFFEKLIRKEKQLDKEQISKPKKPSMPPLPALFPKKELIECMNCQQKLESVYFSKTDQGLQICNECFQDMSMALDNYESKKPGAMQPEKKPEKNKPKMNTFLKPQPKKEPGAKPVPVASLADLFREEGEVSPIKPKQEEEFRLFQFSPINRPQKKIQFCEDKPVVKKEEKKEQQQQEEGEEKMTLHQLKQCKVCHMSESVMLNTTCRHLMMCEQCLKNLRAKHGSKKKVACPVCGKVGDYQKYVAPIYI